MDGRERRTAIVLLAAFLLVAGGIMALALRSRGGPRASADVTVLIDDAEGHRLHEGPVHLGGAANDALTALQELASAQGFSVETQGFVGLGRMVVSIAGIHNQGACGWVYEVNGHSGDRAADLWRLADRDAVHWFWSCHS